MLDNTTLVSVLTGVLSSVLVGVLTDATERWFKTRRGQTPSEITNDIFITTTRKDDGTIIFLIKEKLDGQQQNIEKPKFLWLRKTYNMFLAYYPLKFRDKFDKEMLWVFREVCYDTYKTKGFWSLVYWLLLTFLFDLPCNLIGEQLQTLSHLRSKRKIQ